MAILRTTDLGGGPIWAYVDHDPKATPTDARSGSMIVWTTGNRLYRKMDDGSTTNVQEIIVAVPTEVQTINTINVLPQPATNGTVGNATTTSTAYEVKARFVLDFATLAQQGTTATGRMHCRAYINANNGDVRFYNVTDDVEMVVINFTETSATTKSGNMSTLPTTGVKIVECQARRNGVTGTLNIEAASADFKTIGV